MPRAFNEAERGKIRERLISAGKKAINRAGPRALVVDEVAREAGISKGSFYSFFPSREEFILAVFEAWEAEHRGALLAGMAEGTGTARERLARFFQGIFTILEKEPGLAKLGFGEIERLMESLPPERVAAHQAADKETLETAFARWAEAGLMNPELLPSLEGLVPALFAIALHKADFPPGSFEPAVGLIAEALALRLAAGPEGGAT